MENQEKLLPEDKPYLLELQERLGDYRVPEIVKKTLEFDCQLGDKYYTPDFGFDAGDTLEDFFDANELNEDDIEYLLEYLIEFSRADDTGGIYVFWLKEEIKNIEDMPIVWFGSEGEMELVASNFKDLLSRLTFKYEYDYITELERFKKWIKDEFDIDPVNSYDDLEKIAQKARNTFQEAYANWLIAHGAEEYTEYPGPPREEAVKNFKKSRNELTGDWLIEMMSRPEWNDEVLNALELLGLERAFGRGVSVESYAEKYGIELGFSRWEKSAKQKKERLINLYLQGISFKKNCTIPLPFGLKMGDTRLVTTQKINKNAKIIHLFRWDYIDSFFLEDKDKIYFFKPEYTNDSDKKLVDIYAFVWNINMDLKNYMVNKISIEEALKE